LNLTGSPSRVSIVGDASFTVQKDAPATIPAGGQFTFAICFAPTTPGEKLATVVIENNDADENPFNFDIMGLGVLPEIDVLGNGHSIANSDNTPALDDGTDFGTASMPGFVRDQVYTIANTGSAELHLTGNQLVSVTGSPAFTVTQNPNPSVAADGGTTTFTVHFAPTTAGLHQATVTIINDDADEGTYIFSIQGDARANSSVQGTIWNDLNNDGIHQQEEPGINGVELILFAPIDGYDSHFNSGDGGHYRFRGLLGGKYKVAINMATIPAGMQAMVGGNFAYVDIAPGQVVVLDFLYGMPNGEGELGKNQEEEQVKPTTFELAQNYPNPFNPVTSISYGLPEACQVNLQLFDVNGQIIMTLVNQHQNAGRYTVPVDGRELASGIYLYTIKAGSVVMTRRMALVK